MVLARFGMPFLLGALSKHYPYSSILSGVGFFYGAAGLILCFYFISGPETKIWFPLKEGIAF
jgi:hypothetical protein